MATPDTRFCPKCGEPCDWDDRFCGSCRAELKPTTPRSGSAPRPSAPPTPPRGAPDTRDMMDSAATEMGLQSGSVLADRYLIRKMLGEGGMGRVYLAEDRKLGIPVAVKILRDILRQDPGSVRRLIGEAKASILLAHPNIVRLHNFEDGNTTKFLVMEYVEGETLGHKVAREGKLVEQEARDIAIEICKGLEHAHAKKVVHRDLKPGNVLLGRDGSVKIADFGIARICRDSMSRLTSQQDSGTLLYMSPEQLDGESGELSDLYSLGVVLYEMIAGDPPFVSGEITAQIREKRPREIEGVSAELNSVVMKCLEKKRGNRFAGIRELRAELEGRAQPKREQQAQADPVEQLISSGTQAFDEGQYAAAIAIWEKALALRPGDMALKEAINRALANEGKRAAQQRAQQEADRKAQEEAGRQSRFEMLKARGNEAFKEGRYTEAVSAWVEALPLNPADVALKDAVGRARTLLAEAAARQSSAFTVGATHGMPPPAGQSAPCQSLAPERIFLKGKTRGEILVWTNMPTDALPQVVWQVLEAFGARKMSLDHQTRTVKGEMGRTWKTFRQQISASVEQAPGGSNVNVVDRALPGYTDMGRSIEEARTIAGMLVQRLTGDGWSARVIREVRSSMPAWVLTLIIAGWVVFYAIFVYLISQF